MESENGNPKFDYNLIFTDEKGNNLKSLNIETKSKIFNEYLTHQSPEIKEKFNLDTINAIISTLNKDNKVEPKLFYSTLANCKNEEYQNKLINKFDFSIFKSSPETFGDQNQESLINNFSENNRNSKKPK